MSSSGARAIPEALSTDSPGDGSCYNLPSIRFNQLNTKFQCKKSCSDLLVLSLVNEILCHTMLPEFWVVLVKTEP